MHTRDSDACHAHVVTCTENPHQGAMFGDYVYWHGVHKPLLRKRRILNASATVRAEVKDVQRGINETRDRLLLNA